MVLKSLKPTTKTVTLLAVATALLFFGCVGTYLLVAGKLKGAQADLGVKQREVEDSKRIALKLTDAEVAYRTAEEQLRTLEKSVTPKSYVPTLLGQLEQLGHETHLRVISVRPELQTPSPPPAKPGTESKDQKSGGKAKESEKNEPPKAYQTQPIKIEVSGSYWNVMSFLYRLTTFPKILAVESIDATPASDAELSGDNLKLLVKMKVTAFVFDEPKSAGSEALPAASAAPSLSPSQGEVKGGAVGSTENQNTEAKA